MSMLIKPVASVSFALSSLAVLTPACLIAANSSGVVGAIEKKYVVTETTTDHEQVTKDGTTMVMKCAGVYSTPTSIMVIPDNQVEDGKIKPLNFFLKGMYEKSGAHVLQANDKVYITKIDSKSDSKGDLLKFTLLSVDSIDSGGSQKKFDAVVTFRFKKGYLDDTPPEEVEQTIEAILAPDTGSDEAKGGGGPGGNQAQAQQSQSRPAAAPQAQQLAVAPAAPPPAPLPAATTPPPTISIGESSTQVLQAMGMPLQMIDLGKKKTFVYKGMKIIFVDDKVSDVQ